MMLFDDDKPWFLPKRYGYGAGLPIAWQGWAAIGSYVAALLGAGLLFMPQAPGAFSATVLLLTAVLVLVARHKTRGGWRWRRGEGD